uniref:Protein translocase subunit SecY n=1 Tax=Entomoneis sp. TaxID=186043 RepID=A0A2U9NQN6_9STRA|nr:preprotein translocase subunit SecY [Entomoneis sp.]AWT39430.1 preprotein translocase subunit SecY [Entomoneis sp.]
MKINQEIKNTIFKRLAITLGILLFIRLGTFLPVPGINHSELALYIQSHSMTRSLVSTFAGNDTFVIGLFTLNIFPYINASILVQLILGLSPQLSKLQKEGDLEGRRTINRLTRGITLIWAIIQSVSLAIYLKQILFDWNLSLAFDIVIWLTTGSMIILWLSELITDYGLGNGTSLLIYTNIISSLPNLTKTLFSGGTQNLNFGTGVGIVGLLLAALYGIVFLQEGFRNIPLISAKQLNQSDTQDYVISDSYIPLRFNQAGVMPIILTTTVLVVPNYLSNIGLFPKIDFPINLEFLSVFYWIGYFVLILLFSSFYSTIVLNPKDMSDQLQKMSVAIPGIRPGVQTTFYLKQVMKRITLIGATMLATLATIPNFIESTLNITNLNGLSSTSLLILAGVVLDLVREVKNIYFSNVYNNMYQ